MYKRIPGIYMFLCKANGDRYIGSSKSVFQRRRDHITQLRLGKSHNKHFQSVWNKYGESTFVFELLEKVDDFSLLLEREQYWIDTLKPELNKAIKAESGFLGQNHSEETKKKLRDIQTKRLKNPILIEKLRQAAKSQNKRQPNGMKGKTLSEETKQHLREKGQQQFSTPESRRKHSEIMREWCTPEMRERISISKTGIKQPKEVVEKRRIKLLNIWSRYSPEERKKRIEETGKAVALARAKHYVGFVDPNGIIYKDVYNLKEFCRKHNLDLSSMCDVNSGKRKKHRGWRKLIVCV